MSHAMYPEQPAVLGGRPKWRPKGDFDFSLWGGHAASIDKRANVLDPNAVVWPVTYAGDVLALAEVAASGVWAFDGPKERKLELMLQTRKDVPHAVAVASGTMAIYVLVSALMKRMQLLGGREVPERPEVIVSDMTFSATALAVAMCGLTPLYVDVDPRTFQPTVEAIEAAITPNTVGVLLGAMYCTVPELDEVRELTLERRLWFGLDDAHTPFGTYKGQPLAYWADGETGSGQRGKVLTGGEGGWIATVDAQVAALSRMMVLGKVPSPVPDWWPTRQLEGAVVPALNVRLAEPQAALLLSQAALYDEQEAHRAAQFDAVVAELDRWGLPFRAVPRRGDGISYKLAVVNGSRVPTAALRHAAMIDLTGECGASYLPLHRDAAGLSGAPWEFGHLAVRPGLQGYPGADEVYERMLMFSADGLLRQDGAQHIIRTLRGFSAYEGEMIRWAHRWNAAGNPR